MNRISRTELRSLASQKLEPALSLYLPLERNLPESRQNPLRFRNLADEAETLLGGTRRGPEVRELLKPVRELEADLPFWRRAHADGLCVLAAPGFFRVLPLPYRCPELAEVGRRFHLSPLAHVLERDDRYHLLAITQKSVRMYRGRRRDLEPMTLPAGMPTSIAEALPGVEIEKSLQLHTSSTRSVSGASAAIFHGQGNPKDAIKPQLRDYFHIIGRHVDGLLNGDHSPLVLAAVAPTHAMFRECCRYPHIVEPGVVGNPDDMSDRELRERVWPTVEPLFRRDLDKAKARHRELVSTQRVGHQLHSIVPAAVQGRVECVFAALGEQRFGSCDEDGSHVSLHHKRERGDVDLVDLAVSHTILHGGDVFVVPQESLPGEGPVTAIFRY